MAREVKTEKEPSGTGVSPVHSVQEPVHSFKITRRNLPHWQEPGKVYFITWRCQGDRLLAPEERRLIMDAILYWHGVQWEVYAAVVMPNHVHLLAQPLPQPDGQVTNLTRLIHSVKSFSAQKINQARGERGTLWQDERYDRIVRDEAEFLGKWQYIRNNPVTKGLAQSPEDYPWLFERR